MNSYTVTFVRHCTYEIEAKDELEAEAKAYKEFENDMRNFAGDTSYVDIKMKCNKQCDENDEEYTESEIDGDGCPRYCPCKEDFPNCYCMELMKE